MQRGEEWKVGLFVLSGLVLLAAALVYVGEWNLFGRPLHRYSVRTKFAGGVEAGSPVRYAGMKVGKVEDLQLDPNDPTRAVVTISVDPETPVREDSTATVTSLGLLGENYIEIAPGSPDKPLLPSKSEIPAKEAVRWSDLVEGVGGTTDEAKAFISEARPRVRQALDNITDLTNEHNRQRVRQILTRMDQILADARPRLKTILANFDSSSAKIDRFMDEIKDTRANLDRLLTNWNKLTEGDDAEVQRTLRDLRSTLARAEQAMEEVRRLLVANREHLDVTLENIEVSSENIREFTDELKQRPSDLIWSRSPRDRRPGEAEKKK